MWVKVLTALVGRMGRNKVCIRANNRGSDILNLFLVCESHWYWDNRIGNNCKTVSLVIAIDEVLLRSHARMRMRVNIVTWYFPLWQVLLNYLQCQRFIGNVTRWAKHRVILTQILQIKIFYLTNQKPETNVSWSLTRTRSDGLCVLVMIEYAPCTMCSCRCLVYWESVCLLCS